MRGGLRPLPAPMAGKPCYTYLSDPDGADPGVAASSLRCPEAGLVDSWTCAPMAASSASSTSMARDERIVLVLNVRIISTSSAS